MCARARFADQALSECARGTRAAFSLRALTISPHRLFMAICWYDMWDLDDEDVQKCLPTARWHYDMEELDEPWAPAWGCGESSSYLEIDEAPEVEDDEYLQDDMFYVAAVDLVFLALCLVSFFSGSSLFMQATHMQIKAVFSATCVVKVQVRRAEQMYVLQFQNLGSSEATYCDAVYRAVSYLQGCGICLLGGSF